MILHTRIYSSIIRLQEGEEKDQLDEEEHEIFKKDLQSPIQNSPQMLKTNFDLEYVSPTP